MSGIFLANLVRKVNEDGIGGHYLFVPKSLVGKMQNIELKDQKSQIRNWKIHN
jgi:hypothetical protein